MQTTYYLNDAQKLKNGVSKFKNLVKILKISEKYTFKKKLNLNFFVIPLTFFFMLMELLFFALNIKIDHVM